MPVYRVTGPQFLPLFKIMPGRVPITDEDEAAIKAALAQKSHASLVARESKGAWSYATVWRVADRFDIPLELGRKAKGYKRLPAERWAEVVRVIAAHPEATQDELARKTGVSRSTVGRVVRAQRAAQASAG
jgi:hypothetical protein